MALLLATVGLYGLITYIVSYRTAEIAIRMALGASPQRIRAQVMRSGMRLLLPGVLLVLPAHSQSAAWRPASCLE